MKASHSGDIEPLLITAQKDGGLSEYEDFSSRSAYFLGEISRQWLALMEEIEPSSFEIAYRYSENQGSEAAH